MSKVINKVCVASFPRSGSTWLREIVESCTNKKTGCCYIEDWGIKDLSKAVFVKTHYPQHPDVKNSSKENFEKCIYLVRNPYDTIYSLYKKRKYVDKRKISWDEKFISEKVNDWAGHVSYWLNSEKETLIVKYEDLFSEKRNNTIKLVIEFLGESPIGDSEINDAFEKCSSQNLKSKKKYKETYGNDIDNFFRKGGVLKSLSKYDDKKREIIKNLTSKEMGLLKYDIDQR